jgi:hypothetical protein
VPPLTLVTAIAVAGAVVLLCGLSFSVWRSKHRREPSEVGALRMDLGLVIAFVGAVALICGLGTLVLLLLTQG